MKEEELCQIVFFKNYLLYLMSEYLKDLVPNEELKILNRTVKISNFLVKIIFIDL